MLILLRHMQCMFCLRKCLFMNDVFDDDECLDMLMIKARSM